MLHCHEQRALAATGGSAPDWRLQLQRTDWAWEFLRRNPHYQASVQASAAPADLWGLRRYIDPALDARAAALFWHPESCAGVLPVIAKAADRREDATFKLEALASDVCVTELPRQGGLDVLFRSGPRSLQLSITGSRTLDGVQLLTPIVPKSPPSGQIILIRRLMSLLANHTLVARLYPTEHRGPRLLRVLRALDGVLAGQAHREIALALFGEARVAREWASPGKHMRDQVRRAVHYGEKMMKGGYRGLLR